MSEIIWKPSEEMVEKANVTRFMRKHGISSYEQLVERSVQDIEWFWPAMLEDCGVEWFRKFDRLYDTGSSRSFEWTRWFIGGRLNIAHNSLVRHARDPERAKSVAFIWECEDGRTGSMTYAELDRESNRFANLLRSLGLNRGDTVGFYLPMIPELMVAFWGCLKAGCPFVPVFSGFGEAALAVRMEDAEVKLMVCADASLRRGKKVELLSTCQSVADKVPTIKNLLI
ncbi:MAG: AMP-dependent synthetase, partial [Deltaproteobacteria bacterium]